MKVRQATPADVPELIALFQELDRLQRDWRVFTPLPGFYDEVGEKYREAMDSDDAIVLVAEDDGEIVGMAYAEIQIPSRFSDERALEVSGVVVRTGYRGRGVGRALAEEAGRFAVGRGVPYVELKSFWPNEQSMAFWRALGFHPRVVQLVAPTEEVVRRSAQD